MRWGGGCSFSTPIPNCQRERSRRFCARLEPSQTRLSTRKSSSPTVLSTLAETRCTIRGSPPVLVWVSRPQPIGAFSPFLSFPERLLSPAKRCSRSWGVSTTITLCITRIPTSRYGRASKGTSLSVTLRLF